MGGMSLPTEPPAASSETVNGTPGAHCHVCVCVCVCVYLVVAPEPGQAVGVHDAEDFALCILPADVVLVPAVWQELVDVVPQQPAVCSDTAGKHREFLWDCI